MASSTESADTAEADPCECGYPADSFACRIRHVEPLVANLKRAREKP